MNATSERPQYFKGFRLVNYAPCSLSSRTQRSLYKIIVYTIIIELCLAFWRATSTTFIMHPAKVEHCISMFPKGQVKATK